MKKRLLLLLLVLTLGSTSQAQTLRTVFTDDLSSWTFGNQNFNTVFNTWSNWESDDIQISTAFHKDWDNWEIGEVTIKTLFADDYSNWQIEGFGKLISISATFIDDFERWDVSGAADGTMATVFSGNFEQWRIDVEMDTLEIELQKAIVFIAVFTSFMNQ